MAEPINRVDSNARIAWEMTLHIAAHERDNVEQDRNPREYFLTLFSQCHETAWRVSPKDALKPL